MQTRVVRVRAKSVNNRGMMQAVAVLRNGGLVAFPTETVYGLGANALDPSAVARVFAAKGRPAVNPLIVHVAELDAAQALVVGWPDVAAKLAARFWPGPLTLVLPKRAVVPDVVTGGGPTVAVRVPAHPVAQALLQMAGVPLAAPSANRSNALSPTTAAHVLRGMAGHIDLVIDGGPTCGGLESTVVDVTCSPPRLLRPGLISPAELEEVAGSIQRTCAAASRNEGPLLSPGMLGRHYAPIARLECCEGDGQARVDSLCRAGTRVGWLTFSPPAELRHSSLIVIEMPLDPRAYASRLYAALHALDDAKVERIVATLPPDSEAWLAVLDRLRRASAAS